MSEQESQQVSGIVKLGEKQSSLTPSTSLPGNRPISTNGLQIASVFRSGGADHPIGVSHMQIVHYMGGNRPIMSSGLKISEIYSGNRPVAPNETDDSFTLMGYID